MKHLRKFKVLGASILAALFLAIAFISPAHAYTSNWIKDGWGGRWGTSCPPYVEHHGNGWETVYEVRHQQWFYNYDGPCSRTGYVKTGQWYEPFPMYY